MVPELVAQDVAVLLAEAKVILRGGFPFCSACWRRIYKADQWRCPYVSCRRWFRLPS